MLPSSYSRFGAYSFLEKKNKQIEEKIVKNLELFNRL